jgi:hypothetical protein
VEGRGDGRLCSQDLKHRQVRPCRAAHLVGEGDALGLELGDGVAGGCLSRAGPGLPI